MTETNNVSQWYKNQNANLREQTHKRLAKMGICIGAELDEKRNKQRYRVTSITFKGISASGGFISLHGNKLRKDGTWGEFEHFIGFPEDVIVAN